MRVFLLKTYNYILLIFPLIIYIDLSYNNDQYLRLDLYKT
jgi:hypothetical protein